MSADTNYVWQTYVSCSTRRRRARVVHVCASQQVLILAAFRGVSRSVRACVCTHGRRLQTYTAVCYCRMLSRATSRRDSEDRRKTLSWGHSRPAVCACLLVKTCARVRAQESVFTCTFSDWAECLPVPSYSDWAECLPVLSYSDWADCLPVPSYSDWAKCSPVRPNHMSVYLYSLGPITVGGV